MTIQTEFEFTLPIGYVDESRTPQRQGVMRLATAMDEIAPLRDPRVRNNEAYLLIILLARTVVRLGTLPSIDTSVIENLYAADLAYLQELYSRINQQGHSRLAVTCPHCARPFELDMAELGG